MAVLILAATACKKDNAPVTQPQQAGYDLNKGLLGFSIGGELQLATIDTGAHNIIAVVANGTNEQELTATISMASGVSAKLNNTAVTGSLTFDFTQPVTLTLSSPQSSKTLNFTVFVENEIQYFGLIGNITAQKSLNKDYNFYFDQFDGSTWEAINCGPTVSTMAIKWGDSTFTKTPADARAQIDPQGGWWSTGNVQAYLAENGINSATDTLQNIDSLVKTNIDNNRLVIFCLDMFYVPQNSVEYQHTSKFYLTATTGWGHFLLVKGYKQAGSVFYLEIYDPYSQGEHYPGFDSAQLKGQDRYYVDDDIRVAANIWWPYVITVARKGVTITNSVHLQTSGVKRAYRKPPEAMGQ